jgi:hypothetical protein
MEPAGEQSANENSDFLRLELDVRDPTVIKYLEPFDALPRQDKALEALRVGVIAIQSASPTLDTKVVEDKFRQVEKTIGDCITSFQTETTTKLEEYFKAGSGSVPRSLDGLFGEKGTITQLFKQYFGADEGKVLRLLQDQVGPTSQFSKSLDPNNKQGVISRIEEVVKVNLQQKSEEIVKQFSLDKEDSALSRMNVLIMEKIEEVKTANARFFADLKETIGIETGKATEAEKGTEKGREFETELYSRVAELGRLLGDTTENVRAVVGAVPRSKKGDYVITLSETTGAPGEKIVIEAKKEQGYRLKDAADELKEAKENREASAGIFAFAKDYEPPEVGDFLRIGHDFYITVDEQAFGSQRPLLFLDSAYKIARALLVTGARKEGAKEIDTARIRAEVDSVIQIVTRLSELATKAKTISNSSKFIEDTVTELKSDLELRLNEVLRLLG